MLMLDNPILIIPNEPFSYCPVCNHVLSAHLKMITYADRIEALYTCPCFRITGDAPTSTSIRARYKVGCIEPSPKLSYGKNCGCDYYGDWLGAHAR